MQVSDEDGYLSRSVTIKANSNVMKERKEINLVTSEITFQLLYSDTFAQLHEERVISVRKESSSTSEMSQVECGHHENFLST